MNNDTSKGNSSDHELSVLIKTLTKSVEYIHTKQIILTFIAAFLLGFGVAALILNLVSMNQKKPPETEMLLKKTDETMQELRKIGAAVDGLALKGKPPDEKNLSEGSPSITPHSTNSKPQGIQRNVSLDGIKVYIHYAEENDKKKAEGLSVFLNKKGYPIVHNEMVQHRSREVRYFHDEDKDAALLLQRHLNDFIAGSYGKRKFTINIKNWGKYYPKASKGSLEVWIFF